MSIFHKATIERAVEELDHHYANLKNAMRGKDLSNGEMHMLGQGDDSVDKFTRVNVEDVLDVVAHFKTAVDNVRRIKARAYRA